MSLLGTSHPSTGMILFHLSVIVCKQCCGYNSPGRLLREGRGWTRRGFLSRCFHCSKSITSSGRTLRVEGYCKSAWCQTRLVTVTGWNWSPPSQQEPLQGSTWELPWYGRAVLLVSISNYIDSGQLMKNATRGLYQRNSLQAKYALIGGLIPLKSTRFFSS